MAGDTFVPFYGEFLVSPIPIELSFNYCSHVCGYCFANLGKPDRKADIQATLNTLADYRNRETLVATLLQQGYPVLVSNRVDPFASSNYRQFLPVLELMVDLGIPVALQTKGGKGIDKALDLLKSPSVWYVTIEGDNNERFKQIAPGAPTIDERFDLISLLKSRGHHVVVGVNPCVKEWIDKPIEFLARLKAVGVHGVWLQELHFNTNQTRNLKPREREAIGEETIKRCSSKQSNKYDVDFVDWMAEQALLIGLEPYVQYQCRESWFFEPFRICYEKTFPVMQDLVNAACTQLQPEDALEKQEFVDFMLPRLPKGIHQTGHYICSTNYSLCNEYAKTSGTKWNHNKSYRTLLEMAWSDSRIKFSPGRNLGFQFAVDEDGKTWVDEKGEPFLVWTSKPSYDWDFVLAA